MHSARGPWHSRAACTWQLRGCLGPAHARAAAHAVGARHRCEGHGRSSPLSPNAQALVWLSGAAHVPPHAAHVRALACRQAVPPQQPGPCSPCRRFEGAATKNLQQNRDLPSGRRGGTRCRVCGRRRRRAPAQGSAAQLAACSLFVIQLRDRRHSGICFLAASRTEQ